MKMLLMLILSIFLFMSYSEAQFFCSEVLNNGLQPKKSGAELTYHYKSAEPTESLKDSEQGSTSIAPAYLAANRISDMRQAGFNTIIEMLTDPQTPIRLLDLPVLEIGPYANPIAHLNDFMGPRKWVIWDADQASVLNATQLKPDQTIGFTVNLNTLSEARYRTFINDNAKQLELAEGEKLKFSAIIISSVFNYLFVKGQNQTAELSTELWMKRLFNLLPEGGYLIVGNTDGQGIGALMGKGLPPSKAIQKFVSDHKNQLEVTAYAKSVATRDEHTALIIKKTALQNTHSPSFEKYEVRKESAKKTFGPKELMWGQHPRQAASTLREMTPEVNSALSNINEISLGILNNQSILPDHILKRYAQQTDRTRPDYFPASLKFHKDPVKTFLDVLEAKDFEALRSLLISPTADWRLPVLLKKSVLFLIANMRNTDNLVTLDFIATALESVKSELKTKTTKSRLKSDHLEITQFTQLNWDMTFIPLILRNPELAPHLLAKYETYLSTEISHQQPQSGIFRSLYVAKNASSEFILKHKTWIENSALQKNGGYYHAPEKTIPINLQIVQIILESAKTEDRETRWQIIKTKVEQLPKEGFAPFEWPMEFNQ